MKGRLRKDTHRLGYNTRDNPQDVPDEACRMMVNCYPGHPSPFPRDGISLWNTHALPAAPSHVFPWLDKAEPKQILHIGTGFYWQMTGTGTLTTIATGVVPLDTALSYFRIKDMLYVNTDIAGADHLAWIFEWDGTTFTMRNANIAPPDIIPLVVAGAGANMPDGKFRSYAFTFVNRNDELSKDVGGDPLVCDLQNISTEAGFHPGILESVEDIDQRVTFENDTGSACAPTLSVSLDVGGTVDDQATHLRIWVTEDGDSAVEVEGLDHRWLADVPVKGSHAVGTPPWTWDDFTETGELAGDLNLLKTTGFDPIPSGTYMLFHLGHLWVGGAGTGEEIGRNFYSEAPQDAEFPTKWFSLFSQALNFKDTSYEDAEPAAGIGLSQNDVIFIGRRSVYFLRDGDPLFEPSLMDKNKGTPFPNSITAVNQDVLYISNDGPVAIVGRQVQVLDAHTAAEVWPRIHDNTVGYFFGLADRSVVRGFYYRETWWLTDGVKLIGLFMPSSGTSIGPWEVQVADGTIGFGLPCVLDADSICVLTSGTQSTPSLWHFLHKGFSADNGVDYWLKSASKAYYIDPKNRDRCGELYRLKTFAHYRDAAPLFVTLKSDFLRYHMELAYDQYGGTSPLVPPDSSAYFRNVMEQPIPDGFFGDFFEVEWRKQYRAPYGFTHKGWVLEYKPVDGRPEDFVSKSVGDGLLEQHPDTLLYLKFDDNQGLAVDFSLYGRDHTYAAGAGGSRAFLESMVPAGGQSLVGGVGSGYSNADWTGLDHIGVDAGLNDSPLSYEWVFNCPTLASGGPVIQEAGDGTNYWRLRVNTDGSLEFQLKTSALAWKWTSPAGTVVVDQDYFIQFVLSNSGNNGQFYGGVRTGDFNNYVTTRAVLV